MHAVDYSKDQAERENPGSWVMPILSLMSWVTRLGQLCFLNWNSFSFSFKNKIVKLYFLRKESNRPKLI